MPPTWRGQGNKLSQTEASLPTSVSNVFQDPDCLPKRCKSFASYRSAPAAISWPPGLLGALLGTASWHSAKQPWLSTKCEARHASSQKDLLGSLPPYGTPRDLGGTHATECSITASQGRSLHGGLCMALLCHGLNHSTSMCRTSRSFMISRA